MKKTFGFFGGVCLFFLFIVGAYLGVLHLTGNIHTVIANKVYRSEHLGPKHLQQVIHTYRIKTVLDLAPISDLKTEESIAQGDHIAYIYYPLSSMGKTPVVKLKKLTSILMHAKAPVLIHCKAGSDRTGLASAVALILNNAAIDDAMDQVDLIRYGIINEHSTGRVTLAHYVKWLQTYHKRSSQRHYLDWLNGLSS
jgi:undecaprenyl-diphosphatase